MDPTYAVTWDETGAALHSGKLELRSHGLVLEGRANGGRSAVVEVAYEDLSGIRVGRTAEERIAERQTLLLDRRSGARVRIAGVVQAGIVAELAERLAQRLLPRRVGAPMLVILPLKPGAGERVRHLLAHGPPFDPQAAGLERHRVFVTDREAVFLFEATGEPAIERVLNEIELWAAAASWRECLAGPPRLADVAYSWTRAAGVEDGVSFAATPGPGDSEGGDVFSPTAT